MHYAVTARFKQETAAEFHRLLRNDTIENQRPDGKEIVASMQRAVIGHDGVVRWSEKCYCPTPLQHERATVYDRFFTEIETEGIDDYIEYEGEPFLEFLERAASSAE